jgi:hypothetical protein
MELGVLAIHDESIGDRPRKGASEHADVVDGERD